MYSAVSRKREKQKTRAERSEEIKQALLRAAIKVVGEDGYAAASIAKIAAEAGVAHGTFYNYYAAREDIFQEILPALGDLLLARIAGDTSHISDPAERETARISSYFDFLVEHPGFYRILNEAETFCPEVHQAHFQRLADGYVRTLRRSLQAGHLSGFTESELEALAYMLMGARDYLTFRYGGLDKESGDLAAAMSAYSKLLGHGLFALHRKS